MAGSRPVKTSREATFPGKSHYDFIFSQHESTVQCRAASGEEQDVCSKRRLKGENCQNETLNINKRSRQGAILH